MRSLDTPTSEILLLFLVSSLNINNCELLFISVTASQLMKI